MSFVISLLSILCYYSKNGKLIEKLREEIKAAMTLSPDEVEEMRETNHLAKESFEVLVKLLRQYFASNEACNSIFYPFSVKYAGFL